MAGQYTPEEQAAAWAAYYASQGYDPGLASQTPAYYSTPIDSYSAAGPSRNGGAQAAAAVYPSWDPDMAQQSAAYVPGGGLEGVDETGTAQGEGRDKDAKGKSAVRSTQEGGKRETVIRKAGGKTWEDKTLLEWDPSWFRLFVGDLANDLRAENLDRAFEKYPSYKKSKVVRDRLSDKAKYGFIAFGDPEDFLKAWKEMDGKYVGSRPIRLSKVKENQYGGTKAVQIGNRKAKELDKIAKNHYKPLNNRPTPY